MKIIAIFLYSFFIALIAGFLVFPRAFPKQQVLAESASPIPTIAPTPSPKPTESPTPKPKTPSPTETPTPVPTFTSQQIYELMDRFGAQYNVDPNVLRHIAVCESEFNPLAVNGPYEGLYQFVSITWQNYRKKMGENPSPDLRTNAEEAIQTAAYALSLGNSGIWPNCAP
ncbi:MAG: transglycosylase SLT domain-containing protein [Patescibacteria group bacterium]